MEEKNCTKKRFVKLLMSKRIKRNDAQQIAQKVHNEFGYYTEKAALNFLK